MMGISRRWCLFVSQGLKVRVLRDGEALGDRSAGGNCHSEHGGSIFSACSEQWESMGPCGQEQIAIQNDGGGRVARGDDLIQRPEGEEGGLYGSGETLDGWTTHPRRSFKSIARDHYCDTFPLIYSNETDQMER